MAEKTVAAISTPLGTGGIGVIRISGGDAIAVADRSFRAAFGDVCLPDGTVLDEAVALVFRAPKSYTGEDVVELSLHGGTEILKQALRLVLDCGAHAADGGEFTKRAFLNGKMPLSKAEGVMDLINARSAAALKISRAAADGRIDRAVGDITALLKKTAAAVAAFSDFPDEELEGVNYDAFLTDLTAAEAALLKLVNSYDDGKLIREGVRCVIAGKPNVGKSTLMNLLCGEERSIVTEIPGTTRDIVETAVNLGDITLVLSDTAGIRDAEDAVERRGVEKAKEKAENADLVLAVFDSSRSLDSDDRELLNRLKGKRFIAVINKSDLDRNLDLSEFEGIDAVTVSAATGEGRPALANKICEICRAENLSEADAVLLSERQRDCAKRALEGTAAAKEALLSGMTPDAVGVCVDDALSALFELTGERVTNEVADEIFRRFCVGK